KRVFGARLWAERETGAPALEGCAARGFFGPDFDVAGEAHELEYFVDAREGGLTAPRVREAGGDFAVGALAGGVRAVGGHHFVDAVGNTVSVAGDAVALGGGIQKNFGLPAIKYQWHSRRSFRP